MDNRILISAAINTVLVLVLVVFQYNELTSKSWSDSLIYVIYGFVSDAVALVGLILWIRMLVYPEKVSLTFQIFLAVHLIIWAVCFVCLSILVHPRSTVYLFYLFPLVVGILLAFSIRSRLRGNLS